MARAAIILAAGQGTRMKSAKPKVMHAVAGLPILGHVIAAARGAGVERIVVVIAPRRRDVEAFALQPGRGDRRAGPPARHRPCSRLRAQCARRISAARSSSPMATCRSSRPRRSRPRSRRRRSRAWPLSRSVQEHRLWPRHHASRTACSTASSNIATPTPPSARSICATPASWRRMRRRFSAGRPRSTTTMRRRNIISPTFRRSPKARASAAPSSRWTRPR